MAGYGKTEIVVCDDEHDLGRRSAAAVATTMRELLATQDELVMILAAGESQITFLDALAEESGIAWDRVVCFNMDDFWDPRMAEQYTCGYQTKTQLYDKVKPGRVELVRYNAEDPEAEADRFEQCLLEAEPVDILCQGIGTSGHLAMCEPGQIDFGSNRWAEVVPLVEQSKKQLIADPNFKDLGYIPEKGITLTLPAMLSASHVFTMVPLALKKSILTRVLSTETPTTDLPATILKWYASTLFCDRNSCPDFLQC
jgi:glucosamine-6-phosphate deaminase